MGGELAHLVAMVQIPLPDPLLHLHRPGSFERSKKSSQDHFQRTSRICSLQGPAKLFQITDHEVSLEEVRRAKVLDDSLSTHPALEGIEKLVEARP
jgi:hypothetical protein